MKTPGLILVITIFAMLFLIIINRNYLGCKNLLRKSRESVWVDKNGKYSVSRTTIDNLDTCNRLSLMTRTRDYARLNCILKIGDNNHFIIVETKNEQFWILNKDKDSANLNPNQILEGPFDSIPFINRKKQLDIANLNFQNFFYSFPQQFN